MPYFKVTFDIVTPESAEFGCVDSQGFVGEDLRLREAIELLFETRTSRVSGRHAIEADDSRAECARWITVYNGSEFETGAEESRSLHFPSKLTPSSCARLVRLVQSR